MTVQRQDGGMVGAGLEARVAHLEENIAAAAMQFDESTMREIGKLGDKS